MANVIMHSISKLYQKENYAVKDVNLNILDKEFLIFVGPSGCGKSTTLRMIAGLEEISEGEMWIDGQLTNNLKPKDRDLSMVFQNYALYPHMTVYENIAFPLSVRKIPKKEIKERVQQVAEVLEIDQLLKQRPKQLSGGQKQRVAIGSAIVRDPKLLLMDEPLSNLDAKLRTQMRAMLSKLHKDLGATIVYVTHDQTEAMTLGTRIVVMKDGVVHQVAEPEFLYQHPSNLFVAAFIGSPTMNFVTVQVAETEGVIYLQVGLTVVGIDVNTQFILKEKGYIGKSITLGIRPEHITIGEKMTFKSNIPVTIDVKELLGAEILYHFELYGAKWSAKVPATQTYEKGDLVFIHWKPEKINLFNSETENNILFHAMEETNDEG